MYLKIVRGGTGAGKSRECYELIRGVKESHPDWNVVMLVPEQFSFTAEKMMTEYFSGLGPNGIEVLTFSRLMHRCLGNRAQNYMTPAGKRMLVYKALQMADAEESPFARSMQKSGFLDAAADMLTEFVRYMITPPMLLEQAERCTDEMLAGKLRALYAIYAAFLELTEGRFLDSEQDPQLLAEWILSNDAFENTCFFLDEFSDFLPQHYQVLSAMIEKSAGVCVTLPIPAKPDPVLYQTPLHTQAVLVQISQTLQATCKIVQLPDGARFMHSPELKHLAENWGGWKEEQKYQEITKDISVWQARDVYAETEHIAAEILTLVREEGYRFRDISVICGAPEDYTHIIAAVFRDAGISYYTDLKTAVTDHPILTLAMSAFDIQNENWSYDAVFRYIRTGFVYTKQPDGSVCPFDRDDADVLENYVLKHGVRGKKMWLTPWEAAANGVFGAVLEEREEPAEDIARLNKIRESITKPLADYTEKTAGRRTVREIAGAFFEFLTDIHLYEGLQTEIAALRAAGRVNEAGEFSLVWNMLVEAVEQTVVTLGDTKCSKEEFAELLRAGLSQCKISIIPSGVDSVFVGSADRSRQPHIRAIFAMGAVQGSMPKELKHEGLLSDIDREQLSDSLPLGETVKSRRAAEEYKLFRVLTAAADKLYISYPAADVEGTALRPAQLVWNLSRLFPKLTVQDDVITDTDAPASEKEAFNLLLRRIAKKQPADNLYQWFATQPAWREKLQLTDYALQYKNIQPKIRPEDAKNLYGESITYSVSRLNEFGKCPFRYFMNYGLRVQEQEVWQIQKFELGSLMHWAVCEFCKIVEDGAEDFSALKEKWQALTDERCKELIGEVMQSAQERILGGLRRDREKVQYLILRMTKTLRRSVEIIRKSIARGDYAAICYEQDFRVYIRWGEESVRVKGTIDRIDMAEDALAKAADLRVVDYKSGAKDFDIVSICNRQDMQLVVYAIAVIELYRTGGLRFARKDWQPRVGGVLYTKLRDDMETLPQGTPNAGELIAKKQKADGTVVLDEVGKNAVEAELYKTDRTLAEPEVIESDFIRIKLNKDGTPDSYSKITSREDFDVLMDYVRKSTVDMDRQIRAGVVDILPVTAGDSSGCDYCPYADICLFDGKGYSGCTKKDEAWEKMRKEVTKQ